MDEEKTLHQQILDISDLLREELHEWETEFNAVPGRVIFIDTFVLEQYLHSLATFLVDKGIVDDEEFTLHYKKRMLSSMKEHRVVVTKAKREAMRERLAVPTMAMPKKNPKNGF
jgi:hypothetical protein